MCNFIRGVHFKRDTVVCLNYRNPVLTTSIRVDAALSLSFQPSSGLTSHTGDMPEDTVIVVDHKKHIIVDHKTQKDRYKPLDTTDIQLTAA